MALRSGKRVIREERTLDLNPEKWRRNFPSRQGGEGQSKQRNNME